MTKRVTLVTRICQWCTLLELRAVNPMVGLLAVNSTRWLPPTSLYMYSPACVPSTVKIIQSD